MLKRRRRLGNAQPLEATKGELEQAAEWAEFKRAEGKWEKTKEELSKAEKELSKAKNRLWEEEWKVGELKKKMKVRIFHIGAEEVVPVAQVWKFILHSLMLLVVRRSH